VCLCLNNNFSFILSSAGINKVTLIGRVGRDLEVRGTEENPVTLFPLATSQSYKQQDGSFQQYTEWHKIVVFKRVLGEVLVRRLGKG